MKNLFKLLCIFSLVGFLSHVGFANNVGKHSTKTDFVSHSSFENGKTISHSEGYTFIDYVCPETIFVPEGNVTHLKNKTYSYVTINVDRKWVWCFSQMYNI